MRQDVALRSHPEVEPAEGPMEPRSGNLPVGRLSMNQITTYRWTLPEDVIGYQDAGIPAIGLWRQKLVDFGEERAVDLVLEAGMSVSSLSYAGGFTGSFGLSYDEAVEETREAIDLGSSVGAECVVVVSGARGMHTANHSRRLMVDALKSLADRAEAKNIDLAVLPMHRIYSQHWTWLSTLDETLEILDLCNHPRVRLAFDAYHLGAEADLLDRIPQIAPLTSVVRISDRRAVPQTYNERQLPGDGTLPLAEILRAFNQHGYRGFCEVEIWSDEIWSSDYASMLEDCRDRFRRLTNAERAIDAAGMLSGR